MKKLLYLSISLFLLSGNLFSQQHKDLLMYLNFDIIYPNPDFYGDTAFVLKDASNRGLKLGYYYGKKSDYNLVEGKAGTSLHFDSLGIALSTNRTLAETLGRPLYFDSIITEVSRENLTIAAWVKCDKPEATGFQQIIGWGARSGINIYIKDGKLQVETESLPDDDTLGALADNTTLNLKTNWNYGTDWTHVAAVFNQGLLQLVVNGQIIASDTVKGYKNNADFNSNKLTVVSALRSIDGEGWSMGASLGWKPYDRGLTSGYNKFSNFFFGSIDELRIYNVSLDTAEISLLPGLKPILLRYYDFESILAPDSLLLQDSSSYHHDLLLFNGDKSTYQLVAGKVGQAMSFDGTVNGIAPSIPNGYDYNNDNYNDQILSQVQHNELTIAAWVKAEKIIAPGYQHIIGWGSGTGINMYIKNGKIYVDVKHYAREDTWGFMDHGTLTSLQKKWTYGTGWNHVLVVFDHGKLDLRINGEMVATDSVRGYLDIADFFSDKITVIPFLWSIDGQGWSVGAAFGWKPYDHDDGQEITAWNKFACFFKGAIDELRIYDYALDSAEYCGLPGSPCPATGIGITKAENRLVQVYPNPVTDILNIRLYNISGNSIALVYNSIGVLVNRYQLKDAFTSINLSGYTNGIYFIQVNNAGTISTQKFIIRK